MGLDEYKPVIVMIGLQLFYATTTLTVRAALLEEMSSTVFVVYRQCIAFLFMAPLAYFSSKGSNVCCLNWKSFCFIFLLALIGVTANQNSNYMGLSMISSSVASAMYNLSPAITFILAYILGLEKVDIRSSGSICKIVGTFLCVGGAAALALLKGPKLLTMQTNQDNTWLIGCLLCLASSFFWSLTLILQVHINKIYPNLISLTAWMCLIAAFQSGIFAFIMEPNIDSWKLTSPVQIVSCIYTGMVSGAAVLCQSWSVGKRGPLFSVMFQPLCTLTVTILGCLFLHEDLYIGSLIGGVGVISGLYMVLWGKAKDYKKAEESTPIPELLYTKQVSDSVKEPLLKHHMEPEV